MPIYEYSCPKCGPFERLQSINDSPLARCPECRSNVTKLISSTSFQLKGEGWYSDGYSGKKPRAPAAKDATSTSKPKSGESKAQSGTGEGSTKGATSSGSSTSSQS